ncbi:MAG: GntR family transcriptional regulator, partial [Pseudomonadota bacterium]|nr:GntR family transcriptional regulator [Pseudomonadota bacterium]
MSTAAAVFDRRRFQSDAGAPLYLRLKKLVTDAVDRGLLAETAAIPGERDVARLLGISRVTVRKAFADLVSDGVLVQRQGAGTFVARHSSRHELPMSRLTSFSEDMRLRGIATDSRWLDRSEGLPTPEEAMVLALS